MPIKTSLRFPDFGSLDRRRRQVRPPVGRWPVDPAPLRSGGRQFVRRDQSRLARREIAKRRAQFRSRPCPARDGGCVRPGLSLRPSRPPRKNVATHAQPKTAQRRPIRQFKIALTERFGQGTFYKSIPLRVALATL